VSDWRVPGFTSTGSTRPDALFGAEGAEGEAAPVPDRVTRAAGCRVWDAGGREYVDYVMALGAVALGYGHPAVNRAACDAVANGVVGPLAPVIEEELAAALCDAIPWIEAVRFLKSGAEAVAAAVRLGRVATGRDRVLGCGYHGWLDWCQGGAGEGVPAAIRGLYAELPFNEVDRTRAAIRAAGDQLAVVVVEPLVVAEPTRDWLETLRAETTRVGAVLVFDEIKTAFRLAVGGAAQRYGIHPDLMVLGKALANGFPLAAVGAGRPDERRGAHLDLLYSRHRIRGARRRPHRARGDHRGRRLRAPPSGGDAAAARPARPAAPLPAGDRRRRRHRGDVLLPLR